MTIYGVSEDFSSPSADWFTTGAAGFDEGEEYANYGAGNGWVRNKTGWNAISRFFPLPPKTLNLEVSAALRLSPKLTDGYFTIRAVPEPIAFLVRRAGQQWHRDNGPILEEIKLTGPGPGGPRDNGYSRFKIECDTPNELPYVLVYVGLWGNGEDAWIQIDEFSLMAEYTY